MKYDAVVFDLLTVLVLDVLERRRGLGRGRHEVAPPLPFKLVETAEGIGFYKPRPEGYGSASDVPAAKSVGMPVYWHNRVGLPPRDDAKPDFPAPTLDKLAGLVTAG